MQQDVVNAGQSAASGASGMNGGSRGPGSKKGSTSE